MGKFKTIIVLIAAVLSVTAMSACGNKSDFELALNGGGQSESSSDAGAEESASSQTGVSEESQMSHPQIISDEGSETAVEEETGPVFVHVCGAVVKPDVYEVERDARIVDVIRLAGGFTDEADSDYHNLAGGVADGQKIYVPTEQEVTDGLVPAPEMNTVYEAADVAAGTAADVMPTADGTGTVQTSDSSGKVNINTADLQELKTLNGIGDKRAQDILDYRTSNGNFKAIEDIKKVSGIKDGVYSKICDDICVQ